VADVILLDQRGAGKSEPDLRYRWDGPLPLQAFVDGGAAMRHSLEMGRRARAAILERGIDTDGYTTEENADDVDDLRKALGLERVSLLGFSYGTHLGLSILRRHGEHVDRAILSGVEGPGHTFKPPLNADTQFRKLAAMVAADPELGRAIPDLFAMLERVLAKLEKEPMRIPLEAPDGEMVDVPIGPFGLKMILRFDIGDASNLPVFPRLLWSIDQGDPSVLAWFVRKRARRALGTHGMNMLMDSASGSSPERMTMLQAPAERSLFHDVVNFPYPQALEVWQPRVLGPEFREPLISTVPTLFLSGTLDWNTPPAQAEEVRWGFTNSIHLIVENAGHEQVLAHSEIKRALAKFLRGDDDVREITASYPPLRFVPLEGKSREVTHPSVSRG
jgi:pimeloyl-ACP methyl ester carboxylesterase